MSQLNTAADPDFRERYAVLLDIGRILTATLAPDDLYYTIYEQASRVLEATGFFISLYDAEEDRATVVFYADRGVVARPGTSYRGSESRAIRERRPVSEDLRQPDRAILLLGPESDEEITRSALAAPMIHEGQVLGVISAQSYRPDAYTEDDLELLTAIADLAAVAVWNARVVGEMERQRRESEKLEEVSRALTASLELDEVLQRIARATRELVEADGAAVWLLRPDGRAEIAITAGDLALPVGTSMHPPEPLVRQFEESNDPLVVQSGEKSPAVPEDLLDMLDAESAMAVPLRLESKLIGALSVSHMEGRNYRAPAVRLLQRLAFHAAIAVGNARLHEKVRTLSLTDPLTRLPNRRHMEVVLTREFAAAERGRSLAIVMFDLNHFKRYNDTHGHQAGDEVLRRFGRILTNETRAMNLAARYGGDEFICVLSDIDEHGGAIHAGRVIKAVKNDPEMGGVGVSAGVATYEEGIPSPEVLIRQADTELYRAKMDRNGQAAGH